MLVKVEDNGWGMKCPGGESAFWSRLMDGMISRSKQLSKLEMVWMLLDCLVQKVLARLGNEWDGSLLQVHSFSESARSRNGQLTV